MTTHFSTQAAPDEIQAISMAITGRKIDRILAMKDNGNGTRTYTIMSLDKPGDNKVRKPLSSDTVKVSDLPSVLTENATTTIPGSTIVLRGSPRFPGTYLVSIGRLRFGGVADNVFVNAEDMNKMFLAPVQSGQKD